MKHTISPRAASRPACGRATAPLAVHRRHAARAVWRRGTRRVTRPVSSSSRCPRRPAPRPASCARRRARPGRGAARGRDRVEMTTDSRGQGISVRAGASAPAMSRSICRMIALALVVRQHPLPAAAPWRRRPARPDEPDASRCESLGVVATRISLPSTRFKKAQRSEPRGTTARPCAAGFEHLKRVPEPAKIGEHTSAARAYAGASRPRSPARRPLRRLARERSSCGWRDQLEPRPGHARRTRGRTSRARSARLRLGG